MVTVSRDRLLPGRRVSSQMFAATWFASTRLVGCGPIGNRQLLHSRWGEFRLLKRLLASFQPWHELCNDHDCRKHGRGGRHPVKDDP